MAERRERERQLDVLDYLSVALTAAAVTYRELGFARAYAENFLLVRLDLHRAFTAWRNNIRALENSETVVPFEFYVPDSNGNVHFPIIDEIKNSQRIAYGTDFTKPSRQYVEQVLKQIKTIAEDGSLKDLTSHSRGYPPRPISTILRPQYWQDPERKDHSIALNLPTMIPHLLVNVEQTGNDIRMEGMVPTRIADMIAQNR